MANTQPEFKALANPLEAETPQDIAYLQHGSKRQQAAYQALRSSGLFEKLVHYTPLLAGTIPLGLDRPDSDLDILCEVHNRWQFSQQVEALFDRLPGFRQAEKTGDDQGVVLVHFSYAGFPVEIFGQPTPVTSQRAYRHMHIEARLLRLGGETAYRAIWDLRAAGLKTEPAFAQYFRLPGDPYLTLLELQRLDDKALTEYLQQSESPS